MAGHPNVTVRAKDETGAKNSVSFNWTINAAATGKPDQG